MKRFARTLVFLISATTAGAQGIFLEPGTNGMGVSAAAVLDLGGFQSADLAAGYSVSGVLDLGIDLGFTLGSLEGSPATDVDVACYLNVIPLKQNEAFPLSVRLVSSYGLRLTSSTYLDINQLNRRAFTYSFGADVSSNIYFVRFLGVQIGVFGRYGAAQYTTETHGAAVPGYPRIERESELSFGGQFGILLRTRLDSVYSVHLAVELDPSLSFAFVPSIKVTAPGR